MYVSDQLKSKVEALRWYHTIDLGRGIVTNGIDNTPLRLARLDLPSSFAGRSVLDIGAWDGFFSFEAERRGASRVVATDYVSTRSDTNPVRRFWMRAKSSTTAPEPASSSIVSATSLTTSAPSAPR